LKSSWFASKKLPLTTQRAVPASAIVAAASRAWMTDYWRRATHSIIEAQIIEPQIIEPQII
jgi:hypothetical protein